MLLTSRYIILTCLLSLTSALHSQVKIDSNRVSGSFTFTEDCSREEFDFRFPYIRFDDACLEKMVNDSVKKILKNYGLIYSLDENDIADSVFSLRGEHDLTAYYPYPDTICDWNAQRADESDCDYKVYINNKRLLGFVLITHWEAGGYSTGTGYIESPFIVDIRHKCLLNQDSLFDASIDSLIEYKRDSLQNTDGFFTYTTKNIALQPGIALIYYEEETANHGFYNGLQTDLKSLRSYYRKPYRKLLKSLE